MKNTAKSAPAAASILLVALLLALLFPSRLAWASITLSDFRAQGNHDSIFLLWETATELNNAGFHLWRSQTSNLNDAVRITDALIPSLVGGLPIGAAYSYEDNDVVYKVTYYYWLESVEYNGYTELFGPVQATLGLVYLPITLSPEG